LLLWAANRSSPCWATYKAWQGAGAQVRRGERGTLATFWKKIETPAEEGDGEEGEETESRTRLMCRAFTLFNSEQVDGWRGTATGAAPTGFDPIATGKG